MSKQGLIYEIICNQTDERYIGSTFEPTVARRIAYHKSDSKKMRSKCKSKQIILRDDYHYGLLETAMVNSRDELRMKEREWFDKLPNINKLKPFVTKEETLEYQKKYYEINRETKIDYQKQYVEGNYEKVQTYRQQYRDNHKEQRKAYDLERSARRKELYALNKSNKTLNK